MKDALLNFLIVATFGYAATSFVFSGTGAANWNYFVCWALWLLIAFCWAVRIFRGRVQRQPVRRKVA